MEASGQARWFERLLAELQFELWIGDAAEIRTKRVRKQKTDSPGCATAFAIVVGESLSADLGTELGKSRCATTAMALPPNGAGAHAVDESVTSCGSMKEYDARKGCGGKRDGSSWKGSGWQPWASRRRRSGKFPPRSEGSGYDYVCNRADRVKTEKSAPAWAVASGRDSRSCGAAKSIQGGKGDREVSDKTGWGRRGFGTRVGTDRTMPRTLGPAEERIVLRNASMGI